MKKEIIRINNLSYKVKDGDEEKGSILKFV